MRFITSLFIVFTVSGCTPQLNDLYTYTAEVKAQATPKIEPYPEFKTHPPFAYTANTLRSPFEQPRRNSVPVSRPRVENCLQPNFSRKKEALEAYGIDGLSLSGSFSVQGTKWALLRSNDGILHKAKVESRIGLFYGKITQINVDSITIEQLIPDGAGCWQRKTTTMTTASKAGE